ncbi:hypothetical protein [Promineifilum sp.]|uniref:hypothetical protein n=1 Tax=Promineifilum sp. TaxID=2664178 RepID=UPI0035B41CC9
MKQRPLAVTILAVMALVAGILALVDALRLFDLFRPTDDLEFFSPTLTIFGAVLAIIVALIWFSTARQLFNLDPRGWMFVVVISIIMIVFEVVAILGGTSFGAVLASLVVPVVTLILAFLPGTQAAFGQKRS